MNYKINPNRNTSNITANRVFDIMSTSLITISTKSNVCEVAKKMSESKVSSILLTEEDKKIITDSTYNSGKLQIVGIITQTDLAREISAKDLQASKINAASIMSPLITIDKDAKIGQAAEMMVKSGIKYLAVKEMSGDIVGVLSTTDLGRYLKQKLMQSENAYLGEELSVVDALSFPEQLPTEMGNQDEQC